MRLFAVHLRRYRLDPYRDMELVEEGFCWPAFFFSVFWALWHRLWLAAAILLGIHLAMGLLVALAGPDSLSQTVISFGLAAIVGFIANDLRGWTLKRRGFAIAAVVSGKDRDAAEQRFLECDPALAAEMAVECRP
jgi:hypothetical protein